MLIILTGTSLAIERNIQEELLELGDYDRHSLPHTVANTTTEVYIKFRINDVNLVRIGLNIIIW